MRDLPLLFYLAARGLWLRRGRAAALGGLLAVSAALTLTSLALLEAMDRGVARSVTESLAGELQVYSASAPDPLSLYGDQLLGTPDYGLIPDFHALAAWLKARPEVRAVAPEGALMAMVKPETDFERALADLRQATTQPRRVALRATLRAAVEGLAEEVAAAARVATPDAAALTRLDALRLAAQPAFWADFEAHREARLTSLEEEIAPLFAQGQQLALFCMGTDIAAFSQAFPRLRLRRGRRPPPGAPGILLNERVYQAALKQPTARALEIGGALTLNSQTRAGYQRARRLEIYGTFEFEGLDEAQITQAYHLIDLDSFRHLYGLSGAASAAEMDALRRAHGLHDLGAAEAEAALFGDAAPLAAPPPPPTVVEAARAGNASALIAGRGEDEAPPDPVIHAAVRLQPGADVAASRQALEAGLQAAGFDVHVVDWRAATGLIGQTVVLIRALLTALSLILAVFILVVVNHSVSLATFERQREIGTLRAIGAGRRFTLGLILTEGLLLSLAGGLIGGGLGALIVAALGAWGLPAPNAFMTFLFSGAALYPRLHLADVAWAVGYVGLITLLSHVAPARMAAGVPPIVAMRGGR